MKYIYGFLLSLANFFKRFYYVNKTILKKTGNLYLWLIFSKEHTSFSFKLSSKNKLLLLQNLQNDFGIESNQINEIIKFTDNIKIKKPFFSIFNPTTVDVDFRPNYDYAILALILLKYTDTKFIYEFGFNQGRIPMLLSNYQKYFQDINFRYYGVDFNKRKGGLYLSQEHIDKNNINLFFIDSDNFLKKYFDYNKFSNSILISTTHEKISEDSLFDYLYENNTYPEIIISDNINEESGYTKFVNRKNNYSSSIYIFEDESGNHQPIYIGISKKLPQPTSSE